MTKFQRTLPNDTNTLWGIIKIFHPDIPDTVTYNTKNNGDITKNVKDKIAAGCKYDWVTIYLKIKGYGTVSIGLKNCNHPFSGQGITRDMMRAALVDGRCTIHAWRFADDLKAKDYATCSPEYYRISNEAAQYLLNRGYQLQSLDEMYNYYYED